MKRKKCFAVFFITAVLLAGICGGIFYHQKNTTAIMLVPLDSRPCNTQYPQVLAQMGKMKLYLPDEAYLDLFLRPADQDALWQWMEETAPKSDQAILFANELFNGSLIQSRHVDHYANIDEHIAQLEAFLQSYPDLKVTIGYILPRLLPSQYDDELWPYANILSQWGARWDQTDLAGEELPPRPDDVPSDVFSRYQSLYAQAEYLVNALLPLAEAGKIQLLIGQDDGSEYAPSNRISRHVRAKNTPNTTVLHGADELTMMLIANAVPSTHPCCVHLIFDQSEALDTYFPYESIPLSEILTEKLDFLNITLSDEAQDTIFIHTDTQNQQIAQQFLSDSHENYLGFADIAYTNRGDAALENTLLSDTCFSQMDCYSGWNTAGNTLGTIFAHYKISQNTTANRHTIQAALSFKAIRYSEDLVYQALLSNKMRNDFLSWQIIDQQGVFIQHGDSALATLQARFDPYGQKISTLLCQKQHLLGGSYAAKGANYQVYFPWPRAFEIKSVWDIDC